MSAIGMWTAGHMQLFSFVVSKANAELEEGTFYGWSFLRELGKQKRSAPSFFNLHTLKISL